MKRPRFRAMSHWRNLTLIRGYLFVIAVAFVLGTLAGPADALMIIDPIDYTPPSAGSKIAGPLKSDFLTLDPTDTGDLHGTVYFDGLQIFTYELAVTPGVNHVSAFSTAPGLIGFNGVAGYDFTEAVGAVGGAGISAFMITLFDDGSISWTNSSGLWGANEKITLFYESTFGPGQGNYRMLNGGPAQTTNFFPTPEPASMALLSMGFAGLLGVVRRFRKS